MKNPRTIPVFDVGNVLLRWDPRNLYRRLIADEGEREHFLTHVCPDSWNLEIDGGKPFAQAIAERVALFPDKTDLIRAFDACWLETLGGAIEGSVAILEELQANGIATYAITNFSREKFTESCRYFSFLNGFDGIVVSAHERLLKPDRRIYDLLCSRHGLAAADCLFIDDNRANVDGARAAGMRGHHFTEPKLLRAELKAAGLPLA
jgi:2-haloacid dehalogenase